MTADTDADPGAAQRGGAPESGSAISGACEPAVTELITLDRAECLRLLAASSFGRIAVRTHDGTPAIRPLNYRFDEPSQSIVFRTGRGSKLHALLEVGHAAFEIDKTETDGATGWSVIVSGVTEEILNRSELDRLTALELEPWAPSDKPHVVRLRAFTVSGRRVAPVSR